MVLSAGVVHEIGEPDSGDEDGVNHVSAASQKLSHPESEVGAEELSA